MNLPKHISDKIAKSKVSFTGLIVNLAIGSIALSLSVMIIASSMINGFQKEITKKIFGFWGHIHIYDTNYNRSYEIMPIDKSHEFYNELKNLENFELQDKLEGLGLQSQEKINENTAIDHVQSFTIVPGFLTIKNDFEGILAKGISDDFDWDRMSKFLISGERLIIDKEQASSEAIISKVIADRMHLELGQKFILNFILNKTEYKRAFKVKGIYNTGLEEYDRKFILIDNSKIQDILDWNSNQCGGLEIFVKDISSIDLISDYIYYETLPSNLYSETIKVKFRNIFEWLDLQNINEIVILMLMLLVTIINMITALLILILERTHMIGVLKTIGMHDWKIRKIFLYQAARILIRGMIIGTLLGLIICFCQRYFGFITLDEKNYYLSVAPIDFNFVLIFGLNLLCFFVTLVVLVLPTYLISKLDTIKILKFD